MHLLTFLKLAEPGWFMKLMILGAQGVFFNAFFLSYLASPRTCHRFVGYLEEEAVYTYSRILREMDAGNLPAWSDPKFMVPDIAVRYWNMPEDHRTMRDLMLYVRADEAKHREVNHTLGNLDQRVCLRETSTTVTNAGIGGPESIHQRVRRPGKAASRPGGPA